MSSHHISIRVPATLGVRLRQSSRLKGQTPSDVVRVALDNYLAEESRGASAYELAAAGLIGCAGRAPKDLSTNPRHLEGFGRGK